MVPKKTSHLVCANKIEIKSEIDPWFCARLIRTNIFSAAFLYLHLRRKKLREALLYEKCMRKTLMKLTTGHLSSRIKSSKAQSAIVNFIIILRMNFSYKRCFGSFFCYMYIEKAAKTTFV